jgi:hypothetical protein
MATPEALASYLTVNAKTNWLVPILIYFAYHCQSVYGYIHHLLYIKCTST